MKKYSLVLFTILTFLIITPVFGKSKKSEKQVDMNLFEIDRLIRRTEFEEALRQLNNYLENKPENFDNAQIRIARIMKARREYRDYFEDLVNKFEEINPSKDGESEDSLDSINLDDSAIEKYYEECYVIAGKLKQIEHNPPPEIAEVVGQIRGIITMNYVRPKARKILKDSGELADKGEYNQAVEELKEGFTFFKDDYYIMWQDYPEIIQKTEDILATLDAHIADFQSSDISIRLNDAVNLFNQSVDEENYELAMENLNAVQVVFSEYSELRKNFFDDAEKLTDLYEQEKELNPEIGDSDASYIPFHLRFLIGSKEFENSGISGVVTCLSNKMAASMEKEAYALLEKLNHNYTNMLKANIASAGRNAQSTDSITSDIKKAAMLENAVISVCDTLRTDSEFENMGNEFADSKAFADYLPELVAVSNEVYGLSGQVNGMVNAQQKSFDQLASPSPFINKPAIISSILDNASDMSNLLGYKSERELGNYEWNEEKNIPQCNELESLYTEMLDNVFETSSEMLTESWKKTVEYYKTQSDNLLADIENNNQDAKQYYDGFYTKITEEVRNSINKDISTAMSFVDKIENPEDEEFGIYYNYPVISKELSVYTQQKAAEKTTAINEYMKFIQESYDSNPQWKENSEISVFVAQAMEHFQQKNQQLADINNEAAVIINESEKKIQLANTAWAAGDERLEYAQWALTQEDFDLARQSLNEARSLYAECLSIMDDDAMSLESSLKTQDLSRKINRSENEYVVRDVREHINNAWESFYGARYDEAVGELAIAKDRWSKTNTIDNEEIKKLLSYVNNARTSQSGFEILPSDPLYSEMSQRLSSANQYFDVGSVKYKNGNKVEGEQDFASAESKLNEVRSVYPLNLSASILAMKIERIRHPKEFQLDFKNKIDEAVALCKNENQSTKEKGYASLIAYAELEPNYNGLSQKIIQVEIDMGKRPKPVDKGSKNRSQTLFVQAEKTFNSSSGNEAQIQRALNLIDQSIDLDTDLKSATSLKDQILTAQGGTAYPDLTPEDQKLLIQAAAALDSNSVARAKNIMKKLLQNNPDYSKNPEYMQLNNEIQKR